ncbi:MAG: zinc ribbon domain-containing protein [Chloroflexi bacterium]|nr:zinc ribbon domain-containing protein [Chloroflexota bacterium]
MPIYEYVCTKCNLKFEELRPLCASADGASCPQCHNNAKRVLSTFRSVSKSESGISTPVGGSSCSSCSSASCSSCGL